MSSRTRYAIWGLGACQCVFWGVLYYGFAVWQVPIQRSLAVSASHVAAAFSLGLLVMALLAPRVGHAFDQGHGKAVVRAGVLTGVAGLLLLASASTLWLLYVAWALIGLSLAAVLYESAFALVHVAVHDASQRLRALAAVTVMGGLASTVFLPLLGWSADSHGWRFAALLGAGAVLLAGAVMELWVLRHLPHTLAPETPSPVRLKPTWRAPVMGSLMAVFTGGTVAAMALTTILVPHLLAHGLSLTSAATVLAGFGLAQLPGRLWLLRGGRTPSMPLLTVWPLVLQAMGLIAAAWATAAGWAALAVVAFGLGAGLHTLARPWLVQRRFGLEAGYRNGQVAQMQGLGRAVTPALAMIAASLSSTATVLLALGVALLLLVPVAHRMGRELSSPPMPDTIDVIA